MKKIITICMVIGLILTDNIFLQNADGYGPFPPLATASLNNEITVSGNWTVSQYSGNCSVGGYAEGRWYNDFPGIPIGWYWWQQECIPYDIENYVLYDPFTKVVNGFFEYFETQPSLYSSSIQVNAIPQITISSYVDVNSEGKATAPPYPESYCTGHYHWVESYGGANLLQSDQNGIIEVKCDWSYVLSLLGGGRDYVEIGVGFYGSSGELLLAPKDGFIERSLEVLDGNDLVYIPYLTKTIYISRDCPFDLASEGITTWDVSVEDGKFYSFRGYGDAMAAPEPATIALFASVGLVLLGRRRT